MAAQIDVGRATFMIAGSYGVQHAKQLLRRLAPRNAALSEIPALDGLRALAVVLVVWHHIFVAVLGSIVPADLGPQWFQDAEGLTFCGVNLFFVLSGFLLFLPYARAIYSGHTLPSAKRFYWRRILRIMPAYYAVLAVLIISRDRFFLSGPHLKDLLLTALMLHDTNAGTFNIVANQVNIAFWTLAVEWQFYMVLPLIALALARIAGSPAKPGFYTRFALGLCGLIALGLFERWFASLIYYDWHQHYPVEAPNGIGLLVAVTYGMKGKFLEVFALCMGLSVLYVASAERRHTRKWAWAGVIAFLLAIAGLAACVGWAVSEHRIPVNIPYAWIFPPDGQWWSVFGEWALGICFALLLFTVLMGPRIFALVFSLPPVRWIGAVSFSIYLWHLPIIQAYAPIALQHPSTAFLSLTHWSVVAVPAVSVVAYYLIERPLMHLRLAAHNFSDTGPSVKGVTDKGVTDKGVTDKGVTDKGVTDKGVTDKGVTDKGVTDKGVTEGQSTSARGWHAKLPERRRSTTQLSAPSE